MAQYTKSTGDNGSVRYKDGGKFVKGEDVPANVKEALEQNPEGTIVDEIGDVVDPTTDTDEGSGDDETVQTNTPPAAEDDSTVEDEADEDDQADEDEDEGDKPAAPAPKPAARKPRGKTEMGGMGFPAKDGKTLSILSNVPHETVKNVGGIMVPLTNEELKTATDTEIIEKLKELGKV